MKQKLLTFAAVSVGLITAYLVAYNLTGNEVLVSARYEMLACEDCNHMLVERSQDRALLGKSILMISSTVDTESIISDAVSRREPICLKGLPYLFNPNLFGITPDAIRFEVISVESAEACAKLQTNLEPAVPSTQ